MKRRELIWRNLWLAVRRSGRDIRSRQLIIRLGFLLVYLVGYGFLLRQEAREAGPWGFAFSAGIGVLALGVVFFIRRGHARDDGSLLRLTEQPKTASEDMSGHRPRIVAAMLRAAVMVDRAGIESLHKQQKVLDEHVGVGRRRALEAARRGGLWDEFSEEEQGLLNSAEGAWAWETVWPWILRLEDVRVMRWVVGVDQVLVPFEFLKPDLAPALELTMRPEMAEGKRCPAAYDLRPAQGEAQTMFLRCVGEGIRRGEVEQSDPELREHCLRIAERMAADESADLLIGTETVAKAQWEQVRWVGQAAMRRIGVLGGLIDYLNGPMERKLLIQGTEDDGEDKCE